MTAQFGIGFYISFYRERATFWEIRTSSQSENLKPNFLLIFDPNFTCSELAWNWLFVTFSLGVFFTVYRYRDGDTISPKTWRILNNVENMKPKKDFYSQCRVLSWRGQPCRSRGGGWGRRIPPCRCPRQNLSGWSWIPETFHTHQHWTTMMGN